MKNAHKTLHRGRVLTILGEKIIVDHESKEYLCTLKGSLKKEQTKEKNLITVGDFVQFKLSHNEGQICHVEDRSSYLSRLDVTGKKKQLIAANIEQVFVTVSIVAPYLKPHLVDRFLISAKKGNMHGIVLINKIDLLDSAEEQEQHLYQEFLSSYEKAGIPILSVSSLTCVGIDALKALMKNKTSVFAGQSGVGKSSLINTTTEYNLRIGSIVEKTSKGTHTTAKSQLLPLKDGGFCIDTPGIKSFGIWDLKKEDIIDHFHEFHKTASECRFSNCLHIDEPDCKVKQYVKNNKISSLRFASYRSLIEEI